MEIRPLLEADDRSRFHPDGQFQYESQELDTHSFTLMAGDFGCIGVIVDAKRDAIAFYEKYGFITADAVEGRSDSRPQPVMMFLSVREIEDGLGE